MEIDLERLDDGSGIEAKLETNLAVWHKTCLLNFSYMKLERVLKKQTVKDAPPSILHTRCTSRAKSIGPT